MSTLVLTKPAGRAGHPCLVRVPERDMKTFCYLEQRRQVARGDAWIVLASCDTPHYPTNPHDDHHAQTTPFPAPLKAQPQPA